ncbi:hypothetical protein H8D59_00215 [bacterium]|nr:hypothetical protein [bacterium]
MKQFYIFTFLISIAFSQSGGFSFLEIPSSAKFAGVAGAENLWTNSMSTEGNIEINYLSWMQDVRSSSIILDLPSRWRFGIISLDAGEFELRDDVPTSEPLGIFGAHFGMISAQYFHNLRNWHLFTGMEFIFEKINDYTASGLAGNIGVGVPLGKNINLNLSALHFGKSTDLDSVPTKLPMEFHLSGKYNLKFENYQITSFSRLIYHLRDQFQISGGVEIGGNFPFQLRFGATKAIEFPDVFGGFSFQISRYEFSFAVQNSASKLGTPLWFSFGTKLENIL